MDTKIVGCRRNCDEIVGAILARVAQSLLDTARTLQAADTMFDANTNARQLSIVPFLAFG